MRVLWIFLLFLFSSCTDKIITPVKQIRFQPDWQFSELKKEEYHKAMVPGDVHSDLFKNGLIEEPLAGRNEQNLQWISKNDWKYVTSFEAGDSLLKYKSVDFVFEGLDTYAEVFLNDSLLISADNMFREWRADGRKFIHVGKNILRVQLYSPSVRADSLRKASDLVLPASDPLDPRISPYIRKAPYQFGWDWAPRFLTMGIWKPVKMIAHDRVYIASVNIRTVEIADTCAWLSADVTIHSDYDLQNATLTVGEAFKNFKIRKGEFTTPVTFTIFNPELWWPLGYGNQKLYDHTIKLFVNAYLVDSVKARTGIRTVELFQDEDEWGKSFYFRVNGLPVFMKGANYVPMSMFPSQVVKRDYVKILNDAASVGMNMIRVWGGGIYESDAFYNLCDELGILVWQDFMFACAMVPTNSKFRDNVNAEVTCQVKRLRNHPCLALWCGNNEIEVAWNNWSWQKEYHISPSDSSRIFSGYKQLFDQDIPALISKLDPSRAYITSSPISNWGAHNNFLSGDMHYWGVWHGEEPVDSFRVNVPRFMSEYGMQSWPAFSTLKNSFNGNRVTLGSDFIKNRQRSYKGNNLLLRYIESRFARVTNVEDLCYLSQLCQADAMQIAIESHRRDARFCMGTLYWQLNDVWDGASWSTLEHDGRWKAAHYALKRLYAEDLIIIQTIDDTTRVYFQTENTTGRQGTLKIEVMDFRGRVVGNFKKEITSGYLVSDLVIEAPLQSLTGKLKKEELILVATMTSGGKIIASDVHCFVPPNNLILSKPTINYEVFPSPSGITVHLSSNVFVRGLMVEAENAKGNFSDNYFDLLPNQPKEIFFEGILDDSSAGLRLKFRYLNP